MLNPMQQQPVMPHQMAPLHHHHQQHSAGPMDQRGAMMQKHLHNMASNGSADMVDWRNGTATSGIPVQSVGGCDPTQQYRHGGQNGPYSVPGAMNGVLHHSQQQQQQQQIRRQAAGYPGNAGPGYPGSVTAAPGYGQAVGGAKAAGGQYGMGVEYGRPVSNGFMSGPGSDMDMLQTSSSSQMGGGGMAGRPMASHPGMTGAKCQPPTPQQQQQLATASAAMNHYQQQQHQQQQQAMYMSSYGSSVHQSMSRSSNDLTQQPSVSAAGHSGPPSVTAPASLGQHQHHGAPLHDRLSVPDAVNGPTNTGNGRKSKEKMASSSVTSSGSAADYATGGQQHRMVPYPTPQQYMLNKRAKYSSGGTSPEAPYCHSSSTTRFDPSSLGSQGAGAPRPLRHLGPTSPEYVSGPRLVGPYPPGGQQPTSSYSVDGPNMYGSPPSGYMQQPPSRSPVCPGGMGYGVGARNNYQLSPLPGNPTPPMTPGLCNGGSGSSGVIPGPQSQYYHQSPVAVDQKPMFPQSQVMMDPSAHGAVLPSRGVDRLENPAAACYEGGEPRLAFVVRDGLILAPFRLEHNLAISNLVFVMRNSVYQQVMSRPDLDVQLKCFHHEDQLMKTNWPASVSVSVNSMSLSIDRGDGHNMRPVFLKRVIQPGHNMLQITVTNCCCSHLFVIQLVHRPTVRSAINGVLSQRLVMADQSVTKIKRSLSQRSMMSGGMHDDIMKISLVCNMSGRRISLPARGIDCTHVQCFDLEMYLKINSERNAWICPVCNKPAIFDGLEVDQFVWGILQQLVGTQFTEVSVDQTASWKPIPANGLLSPDGAGGHMLKAVNPESMMLPTVNTWLAQISASGRVQSPASFGGASGNPAVGCSSSSGVSSRGTGHYGPGAGSSSAGSPWCPPPSVSTSIGSPPDYIGCLSQMSNAFLPASDDQPSSMTSSGPVPTSGTGSSQQHVPQTGSGPPSGMSRQHSEHGSGASLPPTPVGSQLSGSQICTPLDGQSLHPRTPSDGANGPSSACTPGGGHLPNTPLDGSSSVCSSSSSSQKSPSMTNSVARRRESSSCGGSVPPPEPNNGSSGDALLDVQLSYGDVNGDGSGRGSRPGSGAPDNSGIDPADQEALDMLPDNLDDPLDLLKYLGPNGGQSATDGLDGSDTDILSMFSC